MTDKDINKIEDVIEYMVTTKQNPIEVDTWGEDIDAKIYNVMYPYIDERITTENFNIEVAYTEGGGAGMGEYPSTITVRVMAKVLN